MNVLQTVLPGVVIIEPRVFGDLRGSFFEAYHVERYASVGIGPFVQDNISVSSRGVLRGLHVQHPRSQGKLVSVLFGEVFDVVVDTRYGSPTFGKWVGEYLSSENQRQLYLPPGLAHGFVVTSERALFSYKCTDYYHPEVDHTIRWNDDAIGVRWPVTDPILSSKDAAGQPLSSLDPLSLPQFA